MHLAEELAGRKAFIRWALYKDCKIRRIREYGCSDGFDKLEPYLIKIAIKTNIGNANIVVYPINDLLSICKKVIKENPEITHCNNLNCERCNDAVKGGPLVDN